MPIPMYTKVPFISVDMLTAGRCCYLRLHTLQERGQRGCKRDVGQAVAQARPQAQWFCKARGETMPSVPGIPGLHARTQVEEWSQPMDTVLVQCPY